MHNIAGSSFLLYLTYSLYKPPLDGLPIIGNDGFKDSENIYDVDLDEFHNHQSEVSNWDDFTISRSSFWASRYICIWAVSLLGSNNINTPSCKLSQVDGAVEEFER